MNSLLLINILSIFLLSVIIVGIAIPQILRIAFRRQLFDRPDERKLHSCQVPRLGGLAFIPGIFVALFFLTVFNVVFGRYELFVTIDREVLPLACVFFASFFLYIVGIADDIVGIRYRGKFLVQICSGIVLIAGGCMLSDLHGMFYLHTLPYAVVLPLTIFACVFVVNAINLIDGLDGLASGLCALAFLVYGITFLCIGQHLYAMLSFAGLGVLIPFFYYNVFGKVERGCKIFMGDTGSLTLGIMLCFLGLQLNGYASSSDAVHANSFLLAFSPLIVPCFDVVRVFFHRIRNGKSPFLPDKNHIHHKLLAVGMSQRWAMVTIVSASILFTVSNILLSGFMNPTFLVLIDAFVYTVANVLLTKRIEGKGV